MDNVFYKRFEEGHRGSPEEIKKRLEVYQPVLSLVKEAFDDVKFVDLGCGRGEFVELAADLGINGIGVDSNLSMLNEKRVVAACLSKQTLKNG